MRRNRSKTFAAAGAIATSALLLAGCGGSGDEAASSDTDAAASSDESSEDATTSEEDSGAENVTADELTAAITSLTLPDGATLTVQTVPGAQAAESADQITDGAQITPPECAGLLQAQGELDLSTVESVVVGTTASPPLTSVTGIADSADLVDVAAIEESFTTCPAFQLTTSGITLDATVTAEDVTTGGDQTVASTVSMTGAAEQTITNVLATYRGAVISVSSIVMAGAPAPAAADVATVVDDVIAALG